MNPALPPPEPGKWLSAGLTLVMHALLAAVLFYGVQWQRRPSAPVMVDLVSGLPPMTVPQPQEVPRPVPKPEPPKPEEKPLEKPDIALKEPKPEKKPPPKPEPKPEVKPEEKKPPQAASAPVAKAPAPDRMSQLLNQAAADARIEALAKADSARAATQGGGGTSSALRAWEAQIQSAIRANIARPGGVSGRPQPVFLIQLLPSGEIIEPIQLVTSSGVPAVDDAVKRAIIKTARLPLPADPRAFQRQLRLVFDPYDPAY